MNASSFHQAHGEQKGESGACCGDLDESGDSQGGLRDLVWPVLRGPDLGKAAYGSLSTCSVSTAPQQADSPSSHPFHEGFQDCTWACPSLHRWLAGSAALGDLLLLWGVTYLFPICHFFISVLVSTYCFSLCLLNRPEYWDEGITASALKAFHRSEA